MAIDHIEIPELPAPSIVDPFTEKKILRVLEQALPQRDWIGINELPKACTPDGQAYMLKKHDDGFWHVSEAYRGRHECLGVFSLIHDAAEFFYITVSKEHVPPRFE